MPTGNGWGFAVYAPDTHALTALYAHPYRFVAADPGDPTGDGIATPNLVQRLTFRGASPGPASYVDDSHVIAAGAQRFYMPFGVARDVVIAEGDGCIDVRWRATAARKTATVSGRHVVIVTFTDIADAVALVPLDAGAVPSFSTCSTGSRAWAVVAATDEPTLAAAIADVVAWQGDRAPAQLATDELAGHAAWRVAAPSALAGDELALWRQSETILRMAQIKEPGPAHGLILASLPPGEWFIAWARDMSYATVALAAMGHRDEARAALDGYLGARAIGTNLALVRNQPYQISTVRYFGDGSEEADYSGEDAPNVELDSWGLALWAAGDYVSRTTDRGWLDSPTYRGTAYASLRDYVVAPLLANLDPAAGGSIVARDTSIWEQNDLSRMHYAASTISAIAGLRAFLPVAQKQSDTTTATQIQDALDRLTIGFAGAFVRGGRVHGTVEKSAKNDVDVATVLAIVNGLVDADEAGATLDAFSALAVASGGYRRVTGDTSYELHEFVFGDLMIARARHDHSLVHTVVERASRDHHLIPEMYVSQHDDEFPGAIGAPTGAIPMVGYGAGMYIITELER